MPPWHLYVIILHPLGGSTAFACINQHVYCPTIALPSMWQLAVVVVVAVEVVVVVEVEGLGCTPATPPQFRVLSAVVVLVLPPHASMA